MWTFWSIGSWCDPRVSIAARNSTVSGRLNREENAKLGREKSKL